MVRHTLYTTSKNYIHFSSISWMSLMTAIYILHHQLLHKHTTEIRRDFYLKIVFFVAVSIFCLPMHSQDGKNLQLILMFIMMLSLQAWIFQQDGITLLIQVFCTAFNFSFHIIVSNITLLNGEELKSGELNLSIFSSYLSINPDQKTNMSSSIFTTHRLKMSLSKFSVFLSGASRYCFLHQNIPLKFNHAFQLHWLQSTISSEFIIHRKNSILRITAPIMHLMVLCRQWVYCGAWREYYTWQRLGRD